MKALSTAGDSSLDAVHADPAEVGLEAVEMMAIVTQRRGTQTPLVDEVIEEARKDLGERLGMVPSARALEAGQHHRQHLLDGPRTSLAIGRSDRVRSS